MCPLLAVAVVLGLGATGPAGAAEKIRITMAASSGNYAYWFAAIEKGYYKAEGLELDIIKAGGGVATPALASGEVHVSTSGSVALSAILRGAEMKLVMVHADKPPYQLWSTTTKVKSLKDIPGNSIGIQTRGDTQEMAARIVLLSHGIPLDKVGFTPLGYGNGRRAALASGSLPVVVISPVDVALLKGTGALAKSFMLADTAKEIRMPFNLVAVRDETLKKNRGMVKRLLRGTQKGRLYEKAFPDETVTFLVKYNQGGRRKTTRKALKLDHDSVLPSMTEDGTVPDKLLRREAEIRASLIGVAKNKIRPLGEMFDLSIMHEVNREMKAAGWKPSR